MKSIVFIVALIAITPLFAQTDTSEATETLDKQLDEQDSIALTHPHILIVTNYVSQVAYNGRTEGVTQYGISPNIKGYLGKGWALNYEGAIWSASSPKYALTSLGVSKDFKLGVIDGSMGYSRWIFGAGTSAADANAYKNDINLSLDGSLGDFTISSYASLLVGKQRAFFIEPTVGWEKSDRLGDNRLCKWTINPTLNADFGNDVVIRPVRGRANRPARASNKTAFLLLTYSLSLPITLSFHGSELSIAYHYYLPKNVTIPNTITPFGVFEVGFSQRFGFKSDKW